ncbi:MAG: hypothetical protein ACK8QZ_03045 [Anaerolineales bacterium]
MAIGFEEYMQLLSLLHEHPEWREPLRQMLLPEEILNLPQSMVELRESVRELAEAQKRTEQRVEELAEAQKRTEQRVEELAKRVDELAEAQKQTDQQLRELAKRVDGLAQRVDSLAQRVDELAEAQKRTEQRVEELAEAQKRTEQRIEELAEAQKRTDEKVDRLASELGGLKSLIGASLEDEASAVLEWVLRKKGYRILSSPVNLAVNGEVDVILRAQDKDGKTLTVVLEAKARMSQKDVVRWVQRMRSSGFRKRLAKAGYDAPYLVYVHGIRVDNPAQEAAKEFGIGVLKGEGEVLAPQGFLAEIAK